MGPRRHRISAALGPLTIATVVATTACNGEVGGSGTGASGTAGAPSSCAGAVAGTLHGPDFDGVFCAGSLDPYLFVPHPTYGETYTEPYDVSVFSVTDIPASVPAGSTMDLTTLVGVSAATPGTYGSVQGDCGGIAICVATPIPAGLDCGNGTENCPPGCAPQGSEMDPVCQPIQPETCYTAGPADMSCIAQEAAGEVMGSWTLELTSVAPVGPSPQRSAIHGSLTATMVAQPGGTATLTLTF